MSFWTFWQTLGRYEYEAGEHGYTGWYRCVDDRLADGRWPEWNSSTGAIRYG